MAYKELSLREGSMEMPNGTTLFWETNAAGGRNYWTDEIGAGVSIWDTALVSHSSLCFAIAMEDALLRQERRLEQNLGKAGVPIIEIPDISDQEWP
jgi:hypothetical protein